MERIRKRKRRKRWRNLLVQCVHNCLQILLADLGVFVLEAIGELVEERLRCKNTTLEQLLEQQLGLLSHCITTVAQSINNVREGCRRVGVKVLAQSLHQFCEGFEGALSNLKVDRN